MPNPPSLLFGRSAKKINDSNPELLHKTKINIENTTLNVNIYKWEICDFVIENLNLKDGHFISFEIIHENSLYDLFQSDSIFYSNKMNIGKISIDAETEKNISSDLFPKWHKSDRFWPQTDSAPFKFIGQFYYNKSVAYIFNQHINNSLVFCIYKDDIDRQDAEEHYNAESQL